MPVLREITGRTVRRDEIKPTVDQDFGQLQRPGFVAVTNRQQRRAISRQNHPGCELRFGVSFGERSPVPMTSPVDFISGPRIGSASGNLANGKTDSLTEKYSGTDRLGYHPARASLFRPWLWPRFWPAAFPLPSKRTVRRTRCARVDLQQIDYAILNRELDIHQTNDLHSPSPAATWFAGLVLSVSRRIVSPAAMSSRNHQNARRPARYAP